MLHISTSEKRAVLKIYKMECGLCWLLRRQVAIFTPFTIGIVSCSRTELESADAVCRFGGRGVLIKVSHEVSLEELVLVL